MENLLENLIITYAADDGVLKILLKKKAGDPYNGYWMLPGEFLSSDITIEQSCQSIFEKETHLTASNVIQGNVFSNINRGNGKRTIAITNIIITDKDLVDMKKDDKSIEWFDVDNLPKLAYDHKEIIEKVTKDVKRRIVVNYSDILLDLFPSDFTIPEFQNFYEKILGKSIDRRNFRKKIINQKLVVSTGEKTNKKMGRPGTLYRFNIDNMKGKRI